MPVPRHATSIPMVPLAPDADYDAKVTELRVHGVGGTPPDALLADLAPTQVAGDRIAGFYRTSDYAVPHLPGSRRHVECYSWSGLTSWSKSRVLWLVLLPFLLGNLVGWMCSPKTRTTRWRFALHRVAASLGALALTVNAALVAVMITADVLAYQAVRSGLAGSQWWLAPLRWPQIAGYPARQFLVGVFVPGAFIVILALLGWTSRRRYEAVHPPFHVGAELKPRPVVAAAGGEGLADGAFWDGEPGVRLLARLHIAVGVGFLAIVLSVTARTLVAAQTQWLVCWYIAVCAGGVAIAAAVAHLCADPVGAVDAVGGAGARLVGRFSKHSPTPQQVADWLRHASGVGRLALAGLAAVSAGVFAWLQPGRDSVPETTANLPGMAGVTMWTVVGIGAAVAVLVLSVLISSVVERAAWKGRLFGGPLVTLGLGFSILNVVMLGVLIWVAHLVGAVTTDTSTAVTASPQEIYVPYGIGFGVPLVALAAVAAVIIFAAVQTCRWLAAAPLDAAETHGYEERAESKQAGIGDPLLRPWYWSAMRRAGTPAPPLSQAAADKSWARKIARAHWIGRAPHSAAWLLWGIIVLQLAAVLGTWQGRWDPPVALRNIGTFVAVTLLTPLMAYLYSAWSRRDRRQRIAVLWDVGTFWPRSYHPFSPPSYAERAVPDLQRRMWWLHDQDGPVLLAAHSQGAMLAIAALLQQAHRPGNDRVALVTFGAPIWKLYAWAFPAYITAELLTRLAPGHDAHVNSWRNLYYPTDPIGGEVALTQGVDEVNDRQPDPADCWYIYGQPKPSPQGHSGYWADQRLWTEINVLAEGLRARVQPAGPPVPVP